MWNSFYFENNMDIENNMVSWYMLNLVWTCSLYRKQCGTKVYISDLVWNIVCLGIVWCHA